MLYRVTGTQSFNIGDGHLGVIRLVRMERHGIHTLWDTDHKDRLDKNTVKRLCLFYLFFITT